MSLFSITTWDAAGNVTFSTGIRTVRLTGILDIPSGSTGSVPLRDLPSGLEGLGLFPSNPSLASNIAPYCWTANGNFNWRGGVGDFYLAVLDIAGLGGSLDIDNTVS